jgi:hypothetical protein
MFKQAIVLLSFPLVALAQPVVALSTAEAHKQVEEKCTEGCVVLSPADMASIEASIQEAIQQAYQSGLKGWNKATSLEHKGTL